MTTNHSILSHKILESISTPKPVIVKNNEYMKALHLHVGGVDGLDEANGVFTGLARVCGDSVQHRKLSETQIAERGYDVSFVKQVTLFSPTVC